MDITLLLKGVLLGLSIAAPVGPIGILCIRRTLSQGRLAGLVSGLGAASADAVYGFIAGFGLTFLTSLIVEQQSWLRLVGGGFLCYLGVRTFLTRQAETEARSTGTGLAGAYLSTFLLTLTNPVTILAFAATFAGIDGLTSYSRSAALVLGVFAGSALWWLLLSTGVGLLRERFSAGVMRWVNRISGVILVTFGVIALAGSLL